MRRQAESLRSFATVLMAGRLWQEACPLVAVGPMEGRLLVQRYPRRLRKRSIDAINADSRVNGT